LLHPDVDLGVSVCRIQADVAKPTSYDVHVDAGLEQMHGRRVPQNMRRNGPLSVADANIRGMASDKLVQAEARQRPAHIAQEDRA
jgi:hypothetical protein